MQNQDTHKIIEALSQLQKEMSFDMLREIAGDEYKNHTLHLWHKFQLACDNNLMTFWALSDSKIRAKISQYITDTLNADHIEKLSSQFVGYSVSHATLRPYDILTSYHQFIAEYRPRMLLGLNLSADGYKLLNEGEASAPEYDTEQVDYDIEALADILELIAPEGCYFGSHWGNGSDFGFWLLEADDIDEFDDIND